METEEIYALVRRAQAGDKTAANEILAAFRPLICKVAGQAHLRTVREDAEQEAALALLWSVTNFDESRGVPFEGFAKKIVFGRVRTFFLREHRKWRHEIQPFGMKHEESESEDFFEGVEDTRDGIGAVDDADAFRARVSSLGERDRRILSLYYEGGLSLRAIGARMGMKENHVSVVKARAMKKLRRELGAERKRRERTQKRRPRGRRSTTRKM